MLESALSSKWFVVLAFMISCIFPSANLLAQNRLFAPPSEEERILNVEQQEKYHSLQREHPSAQINLLRIGDLLPALRNRLLIINLPDQQIEFDAESTHVMYHSSDDYIWNGRLSSEDGRVALVNIGGEFTGIIELGHQKYKIEPLGGSMHALITLDMVLLANKVDIPPAAQGEWNKSRKTNARKTVDSNKNIEVLVLYTDAADAAVGNLAGTAALAISEASIAYTNSGITSSQLSIDLLGTSRINFNETENIRSDLDSLVINTEANNRRDSFWADAVILFTNSEYFPGDVYGAAHKIEAEEDSAFAIVQADKATTYYAFAHELAHLQGARHQQCTVYRTGGCDDTAGSAHGYGWEIREEVYRWTIMHQLGRTGKPIQYFSNPNVSVSGYRTGTINHNVAQKLRDTASIMADFRLGDHLSAVIIGTTNMACAGDPLSFSSSVSGGTGSYSYRWDTGTNGISYNYAGAGSSYATIMPPDLDLYVKLTVTSGEQEKRDFEYVVSKDGSPNCASNKVDGAGKILVDRGQLPEAFMLSEAYPNPFNPSTSITYGIPEGAGVELVVYDIWGREVSRLADGYRSAGYHTIVFDASHLSSGVYLYRLQASSFVATKRIVLLK